MYYYKTHTHTQKKKTIYNLTRINRNTRLIIARDKTRHVSQGTRNPFYDPLIIAKSVKYSVIKAESIKIVKESVSFFFFYTMFRSSIFSLFIPFSTILFFPPPPPPPPNPIVFPPPPRFYCFPSSSLYCFLFFTHSFQFFSPRDIASK